MQADTDPPIEAPNFPLLLIKIKKKGYKIVKIYLGAHWPQRDIELSSLVGPKTFI